MPLNYLTNAPKAFLKLGQIRKGDKDETGRMIDLDYFRVTFRDDEIAAQEVFLKAYGPEPKEINVRLAFPEVEKVWDANLECYNKGGMIAKAASTPEKGFYWVFYRDRDSGKVLIRDGTATCAEGAELQEKGVDPEKPVYTYTVTRKDDAGRPKKVELGAFLEPVGRLNVVIPEVAQVRVGYLEFRAHAVNDIRNLSAELAGIDYLARQTGKTITGIPMVLRRREDQISKNIGGKLSRGSSWLVHIDVKPDWGDSAFKLLTQQSYPDWVDAEVKALPAKIRRDEDEWNEEPPATAPVVITVPPEPEEPPEQPQEPQPAPETTKTGKKAAAGTPGPAITDRPYSPIILKDHLLAAAKIAREKKTKPQDNDEKIICSVIDLALAPAPNYQTKRSDILNWLVGFDRDGDLVDSNVVALFTWLKPNKQTDGTWKADVMAEKEILILAGTQDIIKKEQADGHQ
jgi:hypothetical protein